MSTGLSSGQKKKLSNRKSRRDSGRQIHEGMEERLAMAKELWSEKEQETSAESDWDVDEIQSINFNADLIPINSAQRPKKKANPNQKPPIHRRPPVIVGRF